MSEPFERIQLVCTPDNEWSILSVLRNGWDSITEVYEHPLLRFFTMEEAAQLRCICSEFVDAVSIAPFEMLTKIPSPDWLESFPNARIKTLYLDQMFIFDTDASAIVAALPSLPTLIMVWMCDNYMEDGAFASMIFAALPSLPALRHLIFMHNSTGNDDFAYALADALPSLKALTLLNVSQNYMNDDGIADDGIADDGIAALAAKLPSLTPLTAVLHSLAVLTDLHLANNSIRAAGKAAIRAAAPPGCKVIF